MSDKKNSAVNRLAGAAILVVAVTSAALAQTAPANDQVVKIENPAKEAIRLGLPQWPNGFVRGAPVPMACEPGGLIAAGGYCQMPVRFVPKQVGPYSGYLVIPVNGGSQPSVVIHLTGTGVK